MLNITPPLATGLSTGACGSGAMSRLADVSVISSRVKLPGLGVSIIGIASGGKLACTGLEYEGGIVPWREYTGDGTALIGVSNFQAL
tara:strand:+ start:1143 stop:1403 length:261 start_codon:yes stop_codon:yes gene_type:complete